MAKVDAFIGVLGGVALLATVAAVALPAADAPPMDLVEEAVDLPEQEARLEPGRSRTFSHDLPVNATAAQLTFAVRFDGEALHGGDIAVTMEAHGPEGAIDRTQGTLVVEPGATSATLQAPLRLRWLAEPVDEARTWDEPLQVRVSVQAPEQDASVHHRFTALVTGQALADRAVAQPPGLQGA